MAAKLTPAMIAELTEIATTNGGVITTAAVVVKAKDPSTALHDYGSFKWDINAAAEEHYKQVAQQIIGVWVTVLDRGDGERRTMRTYAHVVQPAGRHVYRPTVQVLRTSPEAIILRILDQCLGLIRSYPLPLFDPLVAMIEQLREETRNPPAPTKGRARRQQPSEWASARR